MKQPFALHSPISFLGAILLDTIHTSGLKSYRPMPLVSLRKKDFSAEKQQISSGQRYWKKARPKTSLYSIGISEVAIRSQKLCYASLALCDNLIFSTILLRISE